MPDPSTNHPAPPAGALSLRRHSLLRLRNPALPLGAPRWSSGRVTSTLLNSAIFSMEIFTPQDPPAAQHPRGLIKPFCPANIGCCARLGARCGGHARPVANGLVNRRLNLTEPDSVISARGKISSAYAAGAAATPIPPDKTSATGFFGEFWRKSPRFSIFLQNS